MVKTDCHDSTEARELTTIPPETHVLTADLQTQCQTPGILLDQLGQKAQGIPHGPTRTGIFKASVKFLVKEHTGLALLLSKACLAYTAAAVRPEGGLVAVLVHNALNLRIL